MFKKLSLKWKMIFSFLFVSSFMILQGYTSYFAEGKIAAALTEVTNSNLPDILITSELSQVVDQGEALIQHLALTKDPKQIEQAIVDIESLDSKISALDKRYRESSFSNGETEVYESAM